MSSSYQPPSPPPPPLSSDKLSNPQPQYSTSYNGYNADANPSEAINVDTSQPTQSPSSSIIIVIIVIASSIIVSASIYILLRFFSRRHRQASFHSFSPRGLEESLSRNRRNENTNTNDCGGVLESLPIFTFSSVTGNLKTGDCAVCLSKFEAQDQLRLLPLCCHAFHAQCIDTWLSSNLTCPLCRSSVNAADSADLSKILLDENARINNTNVNGSDNGGSFRIEIGSISRRRGGGTDSSRRSYSIGSFDYIVDDSYQVSVDSTHWRDHSGVSIDKELPVHVVPAPPGENLSREVTGGRSWLREYFDRIGSLSFRSSGRLNSRQSEVVPVEEELEEHRAGEEISELFRWLSGV